MAIPLEGPRGAGAFKPTQLYNKQQVGCMQHAGSAYM